MSTNAFLDQLNNTTPEGGNGIIVRRPIQLLDWYLAATGAALTTTTSTNPGMGKIDTGMTGIIADADAVGEVGLTFHVPSDYDATSDHLKLRLRAMMNGSTDTPGFDVQAYHSDDGTTDLAPSDIGDLGATLAWVETDLSSKGLDYGDTLEVQITPQAHSTDVIQIYAAEWEYKSTIVSVLLSDRT